MNTRSNQSNLRHILNANAMFSFTSGLFFLLAAKPLAEFLDTTPPVMNILTIIMFGYAVLIAFNTNRSLISREFTLFTVIGDSAWVLASILLLVLPWFTFTSDANGRLASPPSAWISLPRSSSWSGARWHKQVLEQRGDYS